jgi:hypothetical protein
MAKAAFLPERTIDNGNQLPASVNTSISKFMRPQRQYVLEVVNATGP